MRWLLLILITVALPAANAADILAAAHASISDSERDEPGSPALAKAISVAIEAAGELPLGEQLQLQLALAEAWLDGAKPALCAELAAVVQLANASTPALRDRAAIARAAAVRALARNGELDSAQHILAAIAADPEVGNRATAHIRIAEADIAMSIGPNRKPLNVARAMTALDESLELLKASATVERIPVYTLRLLAMERAGMKPAEVLAWLQLHRSDPAVAEIEDSTLTGHDQLIGKAAPALAGFRVDATGGKVDLAAFRGKPVLIDFFATWCKPCETVAPAISTFAQRHPGIQVLGVSLDNPQSLAQLPAYIAKHAITWPVLGERLGWDGEFDDIWHVNSIPSLFLISPDGRIAAIDLIGENTDATLVKLETALKPLVAPAPKEDGIP